MPFSLEDFHVQGSRILSRSFSVDRSRALGRRPEPLEDDDSDDEEDREEVMVPMADALNAGWGKNNVRISRSTWRLAAEADRPPQARLFHEEQCLKMTAIKSIKRGEQIVCPSV